MIKTHILIAIYLLINISFRSQAQTVSLKLEIRDSLMHSGLPMASIKATNATGYSKILFSDGYGRADMHDVKPGIYNFEVNYIGYKKKDTILTVFPGTKLLVLYIYPASNQLNEVEVKVSKPLVQMQKGKFILNIQESPLAKSGNLWESLKYAPTVITTESGGLTIKGQSTTVYIDGRRLTLNGDDLMTYLKNIPSGNIEKIEVIAHPGASYSSDIKTLINITTDRLKFEGIKGILNSGYAYGRYGRINEGLSLDIKKNKFSSQVGYSFIESKTETTSLIIRDGNASLPWLVSQSTINKQVSNRIYANFGFDFNKNSQLSIYAEAAPNNNIQNTRANNGLPTAVRVALKDSIYKAFYKTDNKIKSYSLNGIYNLKWDSTKQSLKIQLAYFSSNRAGVTNRFNETFRNNNFIRENTIYEDFLPQQLSNLISEVQYHRPLFKGDWALGFRYIRTALENQNQTFSSNNPSLEKNLISFDNNKYRELNYGAFISYELQIGKIFYQLGLRIEDNKVHANNLTLNQQNKYKLFTVFPDLLIQWAPNEKSSWVLSYKKDLSRPDYYQLNPYARFSGNSSAEFRGNAAIKPQLDHTADMTWSDNKKISISTGVQISKDFISTIVLKDGSDYFEKYDNFNARIYYLSAYYSFNPFKFWKIQFNGQALYLDVSAYANVPKSKLSPSVNLNTINTISLHHYWNFEFSGLYTSTIFDGYYKHFDYGNINMAIAKEWKKPGLTLSVGVFDILKTGATQENAMYLLYESGQYSDSRFFRIGLKWNFGKQSIKAKSFNEKSKDIKKSQDRLDNGKI